METTTTSRRTTNARHKDSDIATCACHVYDAECALHAAHQSGDDAWIAAANEKLHQALTEYLAATAAR